jgi:hypothetical protein
MPVFLSFVVMNEERFILAWNTPLPDAAFKLTIYQLSACIRVHPRLPPSADLPEAEDSIVPCIDFFRKLHLVSFASGFIYG